MSIQKDVEKMYINDLEREKKKQKKKKKKRAASIILIAVIVAGLILLFNYLGLGLGGGKGSGEGTVSSDSSSKIASESSQTVTTEVPKIFVDIKVSGSTYIYDGQEISLNDFRQKLAPMNDNVIISITDDNATENAVNALEKMLEEENRPSAFVHEDESSSLPASSEHGSAVE